MLLLSKVLINLSLLAVILVLFYCYQTSNGIRWTHNDKENASTTKSRSFGQDVTTVSLPSGKDYYNVWCIFTKVASNSPMRRKFEIFAESLLKLSSIDIAFHVITDDDSKNVAEKLLGNILSSTGKFMKVEQNNSSRIISRSY